MMQMRSVFALVLGFVLVACGGSPLVGAWTGKNLPATGVPLITAMDADVTFTETNLTADIVGKDASNSKVISVKAVASYTSTDKQISMTLTSVTGTDNAGAALATSTKGAGTATEALCVAVATDTVCIVKAQTSDYTVTGSELKTSIKTDTGTVFSLTLTKK
jgi:hypothetical protein